MSLNPTSTQKIQTIKKHILTQAQYDQLVSDGYVTSHPYEEYYITDANNILDDLDNVNITNPANGQNLVYDVASQKWTNAASAISGMTDVNLGTLANGDILQYDSSTLKWVNSPVPSGTVPSPTAANTYLYSPDGTNFGWSAVSPVTGHDYTHQPDTGTPVSGSQTITYAANTRGSKTVTAGGNLLLDFIVNNGADNVLWIVNKSGSTIDIAVNSVISNNVSQSVMLPENGIDADAGYVCEIGVIVNADGAYITFRNDLLLQQTQESTK